MDASPSGNRDDHNSCSLSFSYIFITFFHLSIHLLLSGNKIEEGLQWKGMVEVIIFLYTIFTNIAFQFYCDLWTINAKISNTD